MPTKSENSSRKEKSNRSKIIGKNLNKNSNKKPNKKPSKKLDLSHSLRHLSEEEWKKYWEYKPSDFFI